MLASTYALGRTQWTFDAERQMCLCVTFDKSNKTASSSFHSQSILSRKGKQQEGDFIERSVSITLGEGCLPNNDRSFTAENVDVNRTCLNIAYCNEPLKEVYHKLFVNVVEISKKWKQAIWERDVYWDR